MGLHRTCASDAEAGVHAAGLVLALINLPRTSAQCGNVAITSWDPVDLALNWMELISAGGPQLALCRTTWQAAYHDPRRSLEHAWFVLLLCRYPNLLSLLVIHSWSTFPGEGVRSKNIVSRNLWLIKYSEDGNCSVKHYWFGLVLYSVMLGIICLWPSKIII